MNNEIIGEQFPDKLPQPQKQVKPKPKYGILIFVTQDGLYEIEVINKEECSLNELLGLVEIGKRKLSSVWDAKNDPTTSTILRELDKIKTTAGAQNKALQGIHSVLQGIVKALEINDQDSNDSKGDLVDDSATQDQV